MKRRDNMKLKRLISWLLASALAASLAVMPIGAAGTSSFGDISDRETAVNADILRLMGRGQRHWRQPVQSKRHPDQG